MKKAQKKQKAEISGFKKKSYNRMTVFFNNEFAPEMDTFLRNIAVDNRLDDYVKNTKERFSAAVRILINNYNIKFKKDVLSKKIAEVEAAEATEEEEE